MFRVMCMPAVLLGLISCGKQTSGCCIPTAVTPVPTAQWTVIPVPTSTPAIMSPYEDGYYDQVEVAVTVTPAPIVTVIPSVPAPVLVQSTVIILVPMQVVTAVPSVYPTVYPWAPCVSKGYRHGHVGVRCVR